MSNTVQGLHGLRYSLGILPRFCLVHRRVRRTGTDHRHAPDCPMGKLIGRQHSVCRHAARVVTVLMATVTMLAALAWSASADQVPDFTPVAPPGGNELLKIGGFLKWIAIFGCPAAFFGGLICLGAGRLVDHRGAHRIGVALMLSAVGVAILIGAGVALLNAFVSGT